MDLLLEDTACCLSDYGEDGLLCETHDLSEGSVCRAVKDYLEAQMQEARERSYERALDITDLIEHIRLLEEEVNSYHGPAPAAG